MIRTIRLTSSITYLDESRYQHRNAISATTKSDGKLATDTSAVR